MQYYNHYGCREFVVALGYKAETIQAYFAESGWRLEEDEDTGQDILAPLGASGCGRGSRPSQGTMSS